MHWQSRLASCGFGVRGSRVLRGHPVSTSPRSPCRTRGTAPSGHSAPDRTHLAGGRLVARLRLRAPRRAHRGGAAQQRRSGRGAMARVQEADAQAAHRRSPAAAVGGSRRRGDARAHQSRRRGQAVVQCLQSGTHRELRARLLGQEPRGARCRPRARRSPAATIGRPSPSPSSRASPPPTSRRSSCATGIQVAQQNLANGRKILRGLTFEQQVGTATGLDVAQQETAVALLVRRAFRRSSNNSAKRSTRSRCWSARRRNRST